MKNYPNTTHVLEELYGSMQVFRLLGFPSDNLYVQFGILETQGVFTGRKCVGITLRWQGKEFHYSVAPVKNDKKFAEKWVAFATAAEEAPPDDPRLRAIREQCHCRQQAALLVLALEAKGISIPQRLN